MAGVTLFFASISAPSLYAILSQLQEEKTGMGIYKIICSLDGQEPEHALYGPYEDLKKRTFPSEHYAKPVVVYLTKRAVRLQWNSAFPNYEIVPVDE
jgi:hypothetical protein